MEYFEFGEIFMVNRAKCLACKTIDCFNDCSSTCLLVRSSTFKLTEDLGQHYSGKFSFLSRPVFL